MHRIRLRRNRNAEPLQPGPSASQHPQQQNSDARRLGVNPTWLRLQWRRLRYNGKIPKDGRRNARVIREDDDDAANDHLDGRPSLAARDRLLQRLITVRNEPRFDLFTYN